MSVPSYEWLKQMAQAGFKQDFPCFGLHWSDLDRECMGCLQGAACREKFLSTSVSELAKAAPKATKQATRVAAPTGTVVVVYCEAAPPRGVVESAGRVYSVGLKLENLRHKEWRETFVPAGEPWALGDLVRIAAKDEHPMEGPDLFGGGIFLDPARPEPLRCRLCGAWIREKKITPDIDARLQKKQELFTSSDWDRAVDIARELKREAQSTGKPVLTERQKVEKPTVFLVDSLALMADGRENKNLDIAAVNVSKELEQFTKRVCGAMQIPQEFINPKAPARCTRRWVEERLKELETVEVRATYTLKSFSGPDQRMVGKPIPKKPCYGGYAAHPLSPCRHCNYEDCCQELSQLRAELRRDDELLNSFKKDPNHG
jgi:hypothetical protein